MEDVWEICEECENRAASKYCKSCKAWVCDECMGAHYRTKHLSKRYRKMERVY